MTRSLNYFFRHPNSIYFSVEKLFTRIGMQIALVYSNEFRVEDRVLPYASHWKHIFSNLRFTKRNQADINHITGDIHYAILSCGKRRINVLTVHDCVMLHRYSTRNPRYWILKWLWYDLPVRKADVVTVISENTKSELLKFTKCNPEKIRVIPNFVDAVFQPAPPEANDGSPRLLFVGTTPNKNLERLIQAITGIGVRLEIVGFLNNEQEKLLRKQGIDFHQSSGLSQEALRDKYIHCDLLVFPSTYEGFGLPIIEAQAMGRPVLTSDMAPMREVAGGGACLVDPYDADSIRNGVMRILNDADYRKEIVEAGFRNVSRFRLEQVADQYTVLYRELLAKKLN